MQSASCFEYHSFPSRVFQSFFSAFSSSMSLQNVAFHSVSCSECMADQQFYLNHPEISSCFQVSWREGLLAKTKNAFPHSLHSMHKRLLRPSFVSWWTCQERFLMILFRQLERIPIWGKKVLTRCRRSIAPSGKRKRSSNIHTHFLSIKVHYQSHLYRN